MIIIFKVPSKSNIYHLLKQFTEAVSQRNWTVILRIKVIFVKFKNNNNDGKGPHMGALMSAVYCIVGIKYKLQERWMS